MYWIQSPFSSFLKGSEFQANRIFWRAQFKKRVSQKWSVWRNGGWNAKNLPASRTIISQGIKRAHNHPRLNHVLFERARRPNSRIEARRMPWRAWWSHDFDSYRNLPFFWGASWQKLLQTVQTRYIWVGSYSIPTQGAQKRWSSTRTESKPWVKFLLDLTGIPCGPGRSFLSLLRNCHIVCSFCDPISNATRAIVRVFGTVASYN